MGQEQSVPGGSDSLAGALKSGTGVTTTDNINDRTVARQSSNTGPDDHHRNEQPKGPRLPLKRHATSDIQFPNKAPKSSSNARHSFVRDDRHGSSSLENERGHSRSSAADMSPPDDFSFISVSKPKPTLRRMSLDVSRASPTSKRRDHQTASPLSPHHRSPRSERHGSTVTSGHVALRVEHNGIKNVPTGPSIKKARDSQRPRQAHQRPCIFMPASCLPVLETRMIRHLMGFFKKLRPVEISMDARGWYLFFEDSATGRERLLLCYKNYAGQMFFREYKLAMTCLPDGHEQAHDQFDDRHRPLDHSPASTDKPASDLALAPADGIDRLGTSSGIAENTMRKTVLLAAPLDGTGETPAQRDTTPPPSLASTDAMDISSSEPNSAFALPLSLRTDRDETSSVLSGTTHSDGTKSKTRRCYVCKQDAAYRQGGLTKCSTCSKRYHRNCARGVPVSSGMLITHSWRCPSCIRKDEAPVNPIRMTPEDMMSTPVTRSDLAKEAPQHPPPLFQFKRIRLDDQGASRQRLETRPTTLSNQKVNTSVSRDVLSKAIPTIDAMEVGPPGKVGPLGGVEASPDPEADDLVAQSFGVDTSITTNAGSTPKTGKLKLTRTKLKPATPTDKDAWSNAAPTTLNTSTPTISSLPPSVAQPLRVTASAVPNVADLRSLARNKMLATKARMEKDLVKKGIIRSVSKGTAQFDASKVNVSNASQVRVNDALEMNVNDASKVNANDDGKHMVEETVRAATDPPREQVDSEAIPTLVKEIHALPEAARQPLVSKADDPMTKETATDEHITQAAQFPVVQQAPDVTAVQDESKSLSLEQPSEGPPAAKSKPKIVRRGGLKSFTLLPCSICKTKISFPLTAGTEPICGSCKDNIAIQDLPPSEEASVPSNVDVIMQDAPSADNLTHVIPTEAVTSHTEPMDLSKDVDEEDDNQTSAADPQPAMATDHNRKAGFGSTSSGRDLTSEIRSLPRKPCAECSKRHRKCIHNTGSPVQKVRRSCDECFYAHRKCFHQTGRGEEWRGSDDSSPHIASPTGEQIPGNVGDMNRDSDTGTSPSGALQTSASSLGSAEMLSEKKGRKRKRKDESAPNQDDDVISPAISAALDDWTSEKLERIKAQLGDSFTRPVGSRMKLVGMALCSSAGYRLQCAGINRWVSDNLPMYKHKEGNWENMLSAQMSQGKGQWHKIAYKEGDGGIGQGSWYEVTPERKDELWQWDAMLKEPVSPLRSPQQPNRTNVRRKKGQQQMSPGDMIPLHGTSADSTPISTPSRKLGRKTAGGWLGGQRSLGRRALSTPLVPNESDDAMEDVDDTPVDSPDPVPGVAEGNPTSRKQPRTAMDADDSSSEDEPIANMRRKGVSLQPRSVPTAFTRPSVDLRESEATLKPVPEDAKTVNTSTPEFKSLPSQRVDDETRRSLAQLLKVEALNLDYSAPSLFEEWPEQHPDNMFDQEAQREAKQAEIRKRPTRKQLFGKPALHSRVLIAEPAVLHESPMQRSFRSPEKRSKAIVDARPDDPYEWESSSFDPTARQKFNTLDDFFDMPEDPIAIMLDGHLAFRDGTMNEYGHLPRAKAVYKAGCDA